MPVPHLCTTEFPSADFVGNRQRITSSERDFLSTVKTPLINCRDAQRDFYSFLLFCFLFVLVVPHYSPLFNVFLGSRVREPQRSHQNGRTLACKLLSYLSSHKSHKLPRALRKTEKRVNQQLGRNGSSRIHGCRPSPKSYILIHPFLQRERERERERERQRDRETERQRQRQRDRQRQ